jgi:opacity protein-like surface antigen
MENEAGQLKTDYKYWGLELPIYIMGQINTGAGKIFIGAGPYVSVGIDAIQSPGSIDLYRKDKETDKSIMHRWDFGLGALTGYEFRNGISINCGYQIGFINSLNAQKNDMTMKRQAVSFGIGYKF